MKRKLADVKQELSEESEQRKLVMPASSTCGRWQQIVETARHTEVLIDSKAFYVDPGYHMFIAACPCGEGADSNSDGDHFGLFLRPTKGNFDAHVN